MTIVEPTAAVDVDLVLLPQHLGYVELGTLVVLLHPLAAAVAALALDAGATAVDFRATAPTLRLLDLLHNRAPDVSGEIMVGDADMAHAVDLLVGDVEPDVPILAAGFLNSRPAAATIARFLDGRPDLTLLQLVCVGAGGSPSVDSVVAAGHLCRLLFEECERPLVLRDAAGMALSVASTFGNMADACATSARAQLWLAHDDAPEGWAEDVRTAGERDVAGSVPMLVGTAFRAEVHEQSGASAGAGHRA
ncbi:MAG: 2-phosphosulfolactate phosphatase [Thermoleophilia bacterium]|nr:2-phosphosulfolactate phosphatase [Thermoleophilia bacterium]